jgi:hypothetical protein
LGFLEAGWIMKHFISLFALSGVTITVTSPFQFLDLLNFFLEPQHQ